MFRILMSGIVLCVLLLGDQSAAAGSVPQQADEIGLWSGPSPGLGILAYTIDLDVERVGSSVHRVFEGPDVGRPDYVFTDRRFYEGVQRVHALYTFSRDDRRIYAGNREVGAPAYFLQRSGRFVRVHRGSNTTAPVVYTFAEHRVYEGRNPQGLILLSTEHNLLRQEAPVLQVLTVLLERAPRLEPPTTQFAATSHVEEKSP